MVRQRIDDAREALNRAAASVRLRVGDALDDWAFARLLVPDGPTYEEAVAKVLEEGGNVYGRVASATWEEGDIVVWEDRDEPGIQDTEYGDARNAARAFVAIERGEA